MSDEVEVTVEMRFVVNIPRPSRYGEVLHLDAIPKLEAYISAMMSAPEDYGLALPILLGNVTISQSNEMEQVRELLLSGNSGELLQTSFAGAAGSCPDGVTG